MTWSDVPICEACWIAQESTWEPMDGGEKLVAVRNPVRLRDPELELCYFCTKPTIFGVYVRAETTYPYRMPEGPLQQPTTTESEGT